MRDNNNFCFKQEFSKKLVLIKALKQQNAVNAFDNMIVKRTNKLNFQNTKLLEAIRLPCTPLYKTPSSCHMI